MSYQFYKILHLIGIFITLGGLTTYIGLRRAGGDGIDSWRKLAVICHGIGLLVVLVAGFGLLARLGMVQGLPVWAYLKIAIWFLAGGVLALIKRRKDFAIQYFVTLFLFSLAAFIAVMKPNF